MSPETQTLSAPNNQHIDLCPLACPLWSQANCTNFCAMSSTHGLPKAKRTYHPHAENPQQPPENGSFAPLPRAGVQARLKYLVLELEGVPGSP